MEVENKLNRMTAAGLLIAIGIVYGDIGTSPLYVMKSVIAGNGGINTVGRDLIIGTISLILWTVTLLTTVQGNQPRRRRYLRPLRLDQKESSLAGLAGLDRRGCHPGRRDPDPGRDGYHRH